MFVREGLDDFRKGCPRHQHPKDVSLPHVHHRLPQATPKKRQNGLPEGAALLSKLPQARKAFLEGVDDSMALHPLALYPHLEEALPPEVICLGLRGCSRGGGLKIILPRCPGGSGVHVIRKEIMPPGSCAAFQLTIASHTGSFGSQTLFVDFALRLSRYRMPCRELPSLT